MLFFFMIFLQTINLVASNTDTRSVVVASNIAQSAVSVAGAGAAATNDDLVRQKSDMLQEVSELYKKVKYLYLNPDILANNNCPIITASDLSAITILKVLITNRPLGAMFGGKVSESVYLEEIEVLRQFMGEIVNRSGAFTAQGPRP